jgi:hypothetical protein
MLLAKYAYTYLECTQGRLDNAEWLKVQLLETRKKVLEEEDYLDTLASMASFSITWCSQGQWEQGIS